MIRVKWKDDSHQLGLMYPLFTFFFMQQWLSSGGNCTEFGDISLLSKVSKSISFYRWVNKYSQSFQNGDLSTHILRGRGLFEVTAEKSILEVWTTCFNFKTQALFDSRQIQPTSKYRGLRLGFSQPHWNTCAGVQECRRRKILTSVSSLLPKMKWRRQIRTNL